MSPRVVRMAGIAGLVACLEAVGARAAAPVVNTLSNGVRVVIVPFEKSTNVSIFTFVPMGLCSDAAGQAQWSHLVEHLVIRSTFRQELSRANAETLPDHMRLDFYGSTADWKEGLSHHRRWLEGERFKLETLAAEKPKVISECDFTSRNFATHKFALAAWSHGTRHSNSHVAMKGDVLRASLEEVQRHRDSHLFVPGQTTVCAVGGVEPQAFLADAAKQLGGLTSRASLAPAKRGRTGHLDITWDLDARHLVMTWPLPGVEEADFAPLMVAAQWLTMQYFGDGELKKITGQVLAGTDLVTPEGKFFYISASLRPEATFADVEKRARAALSKLSGIDSGQARMLGRQLSSSLTEVADPAVVTRQAPPGMQAAMVEGNIGLAFGMNVHRYGAHREKLARHLAGVRSADVERATAKFLQEAKGSVCRITAAR